MSFFPMISPRARGDRRLGETWTPIQRIKNDAIWAIASLALAATRRLPVPALRWIGRTLGSTAFLVASHARRVALANVRRVFPDAGASDQRALVRDCFVTLGELLGETVALLTPTRGLPPLRVAGEARDLFCEARAEGKGVLFASAHLGPWERVAASLVAAGVPLVALARESYDPRFSRLYERLRSSQGVRLIWRASPGAASRIVRTLRSGGVLGVPMDLRGRVRSCQAPFLGHDAPTAMGPARVALRLGSAVIVGTAAPDIGAMRRADPVVTATRIETGDLSPGPAGVHELTRRINRELSHRILAFPRAWVWMHERWGVQTRV